jgi:hypothetical protein
MEDARSTRHFRWRHSRSRAGQIIDHCGILKREIFVLSARTVGREPATLNRKSTIEFIYPKPTSIVYLASASTELLYSTGMLNAYLDRPLSAGLTAADNIDTQQRPAHGRLQRRDGTKSRHGFGPLTQPIEAVKLESQISKRSSGGLNSF